MERKLMIVAEGFDNTGKSTLMKRLEAYLKVSGHMSNGRPHNPSEMYQRMMNYLSTPGISIHDRIHCISDQVYGPILRRENLFETPLGDAILAEFKATPHIIIYCRPPSQYILTGIDDREQMDGVIDHARMLLDGYDRLIRKMISDIGWNIFIYDYTVPGSFGALQNRIEELLNG